MKVLVTGAGGMLGTDVVLELKRRKMEPIALPHTELDVTREENVREVFSGYRPEAVVHCASYTAVDAAEKDEARCRLVNAVGTRNVARSCRDYGCRMVYLSTDYVFDGSGEQPREVTEECHPISVYGRTKYEGECEVRRLLERYFIVRISWTFGLSGKNFVETMLRLSETQEELRVVADQIGSPTYTKDIAVTLADMLQTERYGCYHVTSEGACSWYEFACEIFRRTGKTTRVLPIASEEYPALAQRPKNSRLSKRSLDENGFRRLPDWKNGLERYLFERGKEEGQGKGRIL